VSMNRREFAAGIPGLVAASAAMLTPMFAANDAATGLDREFVNIHAEDKAPTWGLLYRPKGKTPKTAAIIMHPRSSMAEHFLTTRLAAQGYAVLGQTSRWLNNDAVAVQEATLLDIAAGIRLLKKDHGIEKVVAIGHSAGGGLYGFYQAQATTPPPGRFHSTPAGDPPDMNQFDLPALDGFVSMSAPKGEGYLLFGWLDPAVVDESNPLATDWTLDIYDPRNGYRNAPESSKYSQEFMTRFRAAQLERAKRLDAKAYAIIARQRAAVAQMKLPEFAQLDPEQQIVTRRTAMYEEYMVIYRTHARPESDLTYDPSDRRLSPPTWNDPQLENFSPQGIARAITPRGYLSTWSALSSRMVTDENYAKISVPMLVMGGTADNNITPSIVRRAFEHVAAKDKTLIFVKGASHGYTSVEPAAGGKNTQDEAARIIGEWLRARFPVV
jgi:dienelactone hydrolase